MNVNSFMQIYICKNSIMDRMKPTMRIKILDHLRRYQTASVSELSRVLGVTGANIRHHIAILDSNELIEIVGHGEMDGEDH
jgi:DNA-binding transcriptional ArsR family regulator